MHSVGAVSDRAYFVEDSNISSLKRKNARWDTAPTARKLKGDSQTRRNLMPRKFWFLLLAILATALLAGCSAPPSTESASATPAAVSQEKGGQEEFGPYELVENWPQPLPDGPDGVKHAGWTWGAVGAVVAETPDRIWIAQRGELPLPANAKPWTPYGMLTPPRVATGNPDGLSA